MKLKDWRDHAHKFTEKLSEINRQLAFAGIAIIWIFKIQVGNHYSIPSELLLPLFFIVVSLMLDLLHYLYQSIVWTLFHRRKEKQGVASEDDIKAPKWYSNVAYFIFYGKVAMNIFGFIILFIHLSKMLFK